MRHSHSFAAALLAGLALAACSSGGSAPSTAGCVIPPAPQLLYPIPGTTAVPDNVGILIYAGNGQPDTITLFNGGTATVATAPTALPSPLPSPIASPSNPAAPLVAVSFPTLATFTIYNVRYALPPPCNPQTANFGFFQTL